MKPASGVDVKDLSVNLLKGLKALPGRHVLVGIPGERTARKDGAITNAQLGYIHEFGAPGAGIPARPFLFPGIRAQQPAIVRALKAAGQATLAGDSPRAERALHAAGLAAVNGVQARLTEGIPPPLADSTLRARARRARGSGLRIGKGAVKELEARAQGAAPGMAYAKPLIDSGQLRRAITYVVRGS